MTSLHDVRSTPESRQSDITAQVRRAVCAILAALGVVGAGGLTNIIKITVMTLLMLAVADRHAQAAEPAVITLSCDGKLTNTKVRNAKQEPITKMDLVVNFAERTVSFSGHLAGIVACRTSDDDLQDGLEFGPRSTDDL